MAKSWRCGKRRISPMVPTTTFFRAQRPSAETIFGSSSLRSRVMAYSAPESTSSRHLLLGVERVHVHHGAAELHDREVADHIVGRVRQKKRDAGALDDADVLQALGRARHQAADFRIAVDAAEKEIGRAHV